MSISIEILVTKLGGKWLCVSGYVWQASTFNQVVYEGKKQASKHKQNSCLQACNHRSNNMHLYRHHYSLRERNTLSTFIPVCCHKKEWPNRPNCVGKASNWYFSSFSVEWCRFLWVYCGCCLALWCPCRRNVKLIIPLPSLSWFFWISLSIA